MSQIIRFGKYKGQPVQVLAADKPYCDWLSKQDWFRSRYANINTIIVNNFKAPQDTPEHNLMQSKFCDPMMCHAVFELAYEALWGEVDHIRHCKFMFQKYERERESYESCVDKKREEINERKKLIFDGLFGEQTVEDVGDAASRYFAEIAARQMSYFMKQQYEENAEIDEVRAKGMPTINKFGWYDNNSIDVKNMILAFAERSKAEQFFNESFVASQVQKAEDDPCSYCKKMNGCKKAVRFKKNEKKHFVFSYNEVTNIVFEDGGIDVKFNVANHIGTDDDAETERNTVCIQIKPTLGDDYPQVIRQVKSKKQRESNDIVNVVVYDKYASVVSKEIVEGIFDKSGIVLVSLQSVIDRVEQTKQKYNTINDQEYYFNVGCFFSVDQMKKLIEEQSACEKTEDA